MTAALRDLATFGFGQPLWLLLALGLIPLWRRRQRPAPAAAVTYSSLDLVRAVSREVPVRRSRWAARLRVVAVALIVLALARPRVETSADEDKSKGIDVMLVLDASRSMDSKDFAFGDRKVSRREALERVIQEFIGARPRDRIGVVGFAEKAFLVCPLTLDHSWMMDALHEVRTSLGTAIGSGIDAAVDLLRRTDSADKVIIVVTDGLNTSGSDPLESARLARRHGIRLYTIGVVAYAEMKTAEVDALLLSQMARMTGGQFYQAADGAALGAIYRQIDDLERNEFKQARLHAYRELFVWPAALALALLALEMAAAHGRRMRLP